MSHPDRRVVAARREAFREALAIGYSFADATEYAEHVARFTLKRLDR